MSTRLAIDGGTPVRTKPFPTWPVYDEWEEHNLLGETAPLSSCQQGRARCR